MNEILNVGSHPVDLDDGRVLAPGETATVAIDGRHNQLLINQGSVLVLEADKPARTQGNSREDKKS